MSNLKLQLAKGLEEKLENNQIIGLGSGSTAEVAVIHLGEVIKERKLSVTGVPSSKKIARIAIEAGWNIKGMEFFEEIDWTFDGADRVDKQLRLIKGGGGCHLGEKILAQMSRNYSILITEDKFVDSFNEEFPLPIEVVPDACKSILSQLGKLTDIRDLNLRTSSNFYGNVITDSGNYIIDCKFKSIDSALVKTIALIPGVVEHGVFEYSNTQVYIASKDSIIKKSV